MAGYTCHVYVISLLILISTLGQCNASAKKKFDHLVLAQQWPNTFCYTWKVGDHCNRHCNIPTPTDQWTIHGLWPSQGATTRPSYCPGKKFNITQLKPLENDLKQRWPNIKGTRKDADFWKYEWRKHGTCATQLPDLHTEADYFNKTLQLSSQFNLTERLINVPPNDFKNTSLDEIFIALGIGPNVQVMCSTNDKKTYYLQEIRICLKRSLEVGDCPIPTTEDDENSFQLRPCPAENIAYPSAVPRIGGRCGAGDLQGSLINVASLLLVMLLIHK